ncbi:MAG: glycosyltransferase family 4 protein [Cyclobacteriaceae bacterium]|nr:glycosyltransferase family 4 protein [Cyclobacteriaceae bacterium]
MRIVIVNTHIGDQIGGSQIQCDLIAEKLHERGHDVTYLAIGKKNEYKRPYKIKSSNWDSTEISDNIIRLNPDILYWRFNKKFLYKSLKKVSKAGIKIIYAVSNIKDLQPYSESWNRKNSFKKTFSFLKRSLLSRINYEGIKYVDGVTVNNEEHLELVSDKKGIYVPNAISNKRVDFVWEKPFVLWVANVKTRKRPEIFIQLAKKIKDINVNFLMIGDLTGANYHWVKKPDLLPDNFFYLGAKSLEEVNGALHKSLFLVTTSTPEGFSNNIIQAWLQKKAVIAYEFDPGGLIESEKLGYVVKKNTDLLEVKTRELIENDELRKNIGIRAYEFAESYFSSDKTLNRLEDFMKEILLS